MKTLILILKRAKPFILILSAILIVFFAIIISHCATTFAPMWFQFVWYSIGIGFMIWYIASALNGGRNIFQTNKNVWMIDRSSKGYGVLHTGTTTCSEAKEVAAKDMTRCIGCGCDHKERCKRYIKNPEDIRGYVKLMKKCSGHCVWFLEKDE